MSVGYDGTTVTLTFVTVPLKRYFLEYKDSLLDGAWTQIGNILAANSSTLTATDTPGVGTTRRSYRLRALID
jgi:hypothetical protein